tara:strand:+ start:3075 stop:3989 length:915 start_codon:yes stop_codon:yes gene_type:complete
MSFNQYEREMLSNYQIAFDHLAAAAHDASPMFARTVDHISNELRRISNELREEEKLRKLKGRGPLSELKVKLGISKQYGPDLLDKVPDQEKATRETVHELVKEFFHPSITHLGEGGEFKPSTENLKELPSEVSDLKPGIYRVVGRGLTKDRLAICVQVVGVNYGFVVVSLPSSTSESTVIRALNYVEGEKEWVDHEHYGVVSKGALRTGFVSLMRKLGYKLPDPIQRSEFLVLVKKCLGVKGVASLTFKLEGYDLTLLNPDDQPETFRITKRCGDTLKEYKWTDLPTIKQKQFFELLKKEVGGA